MFKRILRWLNIHEKEIGLFLWSVALLFIIRSAGVILNNYAETAFLKRYGVEFLPVVNMLNAVATVVIMGFVFGLIRKFPGPRLLAWQFLFCGFSVIAIRLVIPAGFDIVYPLLFMLKAQYEALLAMLFWNLANDLFNTRQSKRLFPLITAGGVVGQILASFGTPSMAKILHFDNLLVVYLLITLVGGMTVWGMRRQFPSLIMDEGPKGAKKTNSSMMGEIKAVLPMLKSSILLRIMILLTFMPNVVIPIMNYQFNYAVDTYFASESSMLEFFGYFRGVLNMISLVILLFVGKVYGRWGLPVALMFHPFNYVLAFMAFLLRFDIIAAMYARMSTNILRTTINVPANAMMMGLFPESYRAMVRPFLRGTVVRVALFAGSGMILISDSLFHPRYLSLVALPFVVGWLAAPIILKRKYAGILIDLLQQNQFDLKSLQPSGVAQLFHGPKVQNQLRDAFLASPPESVLWYAQLLKKLNDPDLDTYLLQRIEDLKVDDRLALLQLVSDNPPVEVVEQLSKMANGEDARMAIAVIQVVMAFSHERRSLFNPRPFLDHHAPEVRANAVACLYQSDPGEAGDLIAKWMASKDLKIQMAGIMAAGASKEIHFEERLRNTIGTTRNPELLSAALDSLHALDLHDLNEVVAPFLSHQDERVRLAALSAYHITDKESLNSAILLLADGKTQIRKMAEHRIVRAHFVDGKRLINALNHPSSHLRESVFSLLDKLQIKDLDLYRFARAQLEGAYKYLNESNSVASLPAHEACMLLSSHLSQQRDALVQRVLRVLAIQDKSGRVQIIRRGLLANDHRQRANSQEAIDDLLDKKISRVLVPLLEDDSPTDAVSIGKQHYDLPDYHGDAAAILNHMLVPHDDWVTILITLFILEKFPQIGIERDRVLPFNSSPNPHIRLMARRVLWQWQKTKPMEDKDMEAAMALPDIILKLKPIDLFEGLSVSELAAVASATEEVSYESNEVVIKEGDPGDTLYLVLEGEVAVIKTEADGADLTLDHILAGDHFGEMALFEAIPRTATIRTTTPCRMLMLHRQEFNEMVREYPQIALKICKVFSGRIRKLHQKIASSTT